MLNSSVQFSSIAQSCPTLCNPMNRSTPGLPVHHQLPEFTQIHVHQVSDAIQPSHPLSSPSPPAPNSSQHQSLFQWVNSSHEVFTDLLPKTGKDEVKGYTPTVRWWGTEGEVWECLGDRSICSVELGLCPCFWKLSEPNSSWVLMEASSCRHSQDPSQTQSPASALLLGGE